MSDIIRLPGKDRERETNKPNTIRLQDKEQLLKSRSRRAVLVIDGSTSMDDSKKRFATTGAIAFAQGALERNYAVGAIGFADEARLICKPTLDVDRIVKACGCWPVSGGTFIGAGLAAASKLDLDEGDVVVVVTDGACGQPEQSLEIASALKASGVEILAIGTDDADQSFLRRLASRPDLGLKVEVQKLTSAMSDATKLLKS